MGCDINSYVETRNEAGDAWEYVPWPYAEFKDDGPFERRSYNVFGWLADVRNASAVPPIAARRGLPDDVTQHVADRGIYWEGDGYAHSWLTVGELLAFDYDATFEDRRDQGGRTAEPGSGELTTYRAFLGDLFFRDLEELRKLNEQRPTRVVFWFDG